MPAKDQPHTEIATYTTTERGHEVKRKIYVTDADGQLCRPDAGCKTLRVPADEPRYVEAGRIWAHNAPDSETVKRLKTRICDIYALALPTGMTEFLGLRRKGVDYQDKNAYDLNPIIDFPSDIPFSSIASLEELVMREIGPNLENPLIDEGFRELLLGRRDIVFAEGSEQHFVQIIQGLALRYLKDHQLGDDTLAWLEGATIYAHTNSANEVYFLYCDTADSSRDRHRGEIMDFEPDFQDYVQKHKKGLFLAARPALAGFKRLVPLTAPASDPIQRLRRHSYERINLPATILVPFPHGFSAHQKLACEKRLSDAIKRAAGDAA